MVVILLESKQTFGFSKLLRLGCIEVHREKHTSGILTPQSIFTTDT